MLKITSLFFASFLSATIVPFSSEAILAGIIVTGVKPTIAIIVASIGNWLGGITSYYLGYLGKWEWLEKYFKVEKEKVLKWKSKIETSGPILAFLTWLPFVGDIFAIGLGYFRINFVSTFVFMLIGKASRYILWYFLLFETF